jgi:hypothetical protein
MNAVASTQETAGRRLSQRLMIFCRQTGIPVDTGHDFTEVARLGSNPQILVGCTECGDDHLWLIDDVFVDLEPGLDGKPFKEVARVAHTEVGRPDHLRDER